jgi:hypothetical protein
MSKIIADLCKLYRPDLSIIDGLVGMEGFGPIDGMPRHLGALVASQDPVAADTVGASLIGIPPSQIEHLRYAERKGVGTMTDFEIVGSDLGDMAEQFTLLKRRHRWIGNAALALGRYSVDLARFSELVRLVRSASSTVGISQIQKRVSYAGLSRLAIDTLFRLEG